jgi:DNA-binding NtrC family response regulator
MRSKQKYSVLVVDDRDNWRELITDLLKDEFSVTSVSNYSDALKAAEKQNPPFHVVIADMRLIDYEKGNEDGLKLIKDLKDYCDMTEFIMITGYATIDSAIMAVSDLGVKKYLEKKPANGKSFDYQNFCQIVHQSAESAEKKRPKGYTDVNQNILLIEADPIWGSKIVGLLNKEGYQTSIIQDTENLESNILNYGHNYSLILLSETLASEKTLNILKQLHVKIILLTPRDVGNIFSAMQENPVITAFTLQNERFDTKEFIKFIHRALTYGSSKYISAWVAPYDQKEYSISAEVCLNVNKLYKIVLSIQDNPTKDSVGIFLLPRKEKKEDVQLHLFVHAEQIKLEPSAEIDWIISASVNPPPLCEITITPLMPGKRNILIDLDQNYRLLARILLPIIVSEPK